MRRGMRPYGKALRVSHALAGVQLEAPAQLGAELLMVQAVVSGAESAASGDTKSANSLSTVTAIDGKLRRRVTTRRRSRCAPAGRGNTVSSAMLRSGTATPAAPEADYDR